MFISFIVQAVFHTQNKSFINAKVWKVNNKSWFVLAETMCLRNKPRSKTYNMLANILDRKCCAFTTLTFTRLANPTII